MKAKEKLYGKLGHYCPNGCPSAQLLQGDAGLTCPICYEVFETQPEPKPAAPAKPAAKTAKDDKGKE